MFVFSFFLLIGEDEYEKKHDPVFDQDN